MSNRLPYTYVILRYRHDPVSGEFVNVGVLLHQPQSGFLQMRTRTTLGTRVPKMFPGVDGDAFRSAMRLIGRSAKRVSEVEGSDLFTKLLDAKAFSIKILPPDDSSFVWSAMGSGVSADASVALDKIFARYVTRFDERARNARADADVWRPVRELLAERNLADRLQPKIIHSEIDHVEFDHAWKNGAWHCYQPVSFDLSSADKIREKAARWAGHMWGLKGSDEEFRPYFVVGAPTNPELSSAYDRALAMLRASEGKPSVIEEQNALQLVNQLEDQMHHHDERITK